MPGNPHKKTMKELIQLGKSLGFRQYSADDVDEPTIQLPKTIDTSILSSVDQIDVIWFNEYNFPKYAFEIEYTTGVDRGIQRLYQLRHYRDCKLFVVIQKEGANSLHYQNRFDKLIESDPYYTISDRFSLITDVDVSNLLKKALALDKLKYNILEWDLHEDILGLVSGVSEEEGREEVPDWVSVGKANWGKHFTPQRKHAKDLFIKLIEKIQQSPLDLEVRLLKWHISLYRGGNMVAVIYLRKEKLVFLIKNIEEHYGDTNLETVDKPETDYIIKSATKYLFVKTEQDIDDLIRLLQIAAAS